MRAQKVAISIPGEVLAGTDRLARRLKTSRSQVISIAIAEYLARHDTDAVTEAMNRVCDRLEDESGAFLDAAAIDILREVEW